MRAEIVYLLGKSFNEAVEFGERGHFIGVNFLIDPALIGREQEG